MSDGEGGDGDHIVIRPQPARLVIPPGTPGMLDVRIRIARTAIEFFDPEQPNVFAEAVGKPDYDRDSSLTGEDFRQYMLRHEGFFTVIHSIFVHPVLREMARANLLYDHGVTRSTDGVLGHAYQTVVGAITNAQRDGNLWLSQALGPTLIIESYGAITVHITGRDADGDPTNASGLVLDPGHILTNAHVVNDSEVDTAIPAPTSKPPGQAVEWKETGPHIKLRVEEALVHDEIDVAVVPVDGMDDEFGMNALDGVAFRDPEWSDETYIFGYPPISTLDGPYLVVQRGEVVNPSVVSQHNQQFFLYSAIARPGNSGGPVIAQDGRVIGLITHELPDARKKASPFYRGVAGGQIRDALSDLGVGHLIQFEDWQF
ncbi:MAG: hypothetical protein JWR34_7437 [Mycobacterium sp.]|nr:hypothetical protein [Mycobacterium sp.]